MKSKLNSIEEALEDLRAGKIIIVVDDEDRENEGDFICAAEKITPAIINFMARYGRGLICTPLTEERCRQLELRPMIMDNTAMHQTAFTVSIDLLGYGCSTGISAYDRATGIQKLLDPTIKPNDYARPGHIFPLIAKDGGVLRRAGHTEASVDLARLAGFAPAGVLVEILNEDGTMARLPDLFKIAAEHDLKIISIEDLIKYRLAKETLIQREVEVEMPTEYGDFQLIAYKDMSSERTHFVLKKGTWTADETVLVRVHSSCITGDMLGSLRCDCGQKLHAAMRQVEREGKGAVLCIQQEGNGQNFLSKLKAYKLEEEGKEITNTSLQSDQRDYGIGAQILRDLGIGKIKLMTNQPQKRIGIIGYGLEIVDNVAIEIDKNTKNKSHKLGHFVF